MDFVMCIENNIDNYIFYIYYLIMNITIDDQNILETLKYKLIKLIVRYSKDNNESVEILEQLLKSALITKREVFAVTNVFEVYVEHKGVKTIWSESLTKIKFK